jgi:hypothetical protein
LRFALRISNVALPVLPAACAAATAGLTSSPEHFPLTMKLRLRQPGRRPQALSVSPMFKCQRDRTGAVRALTVVRPRHPKLGSALSLQVRRPRHLTVGRVRTLTATVKNRTRHTAFDVSIRAFLPPGWRVLRHSRGVAVSHGLVLRRLRTLPRRRARTLRLLVVPTSAGRRCTTVTADATLRKHASRRVCTQVRAVARPVGGRG